MTIYNDSAACIYPANTSLSLFQRRASRYRRILVYMRVHESRLTLPWASFTLESFGERVVPRFGGWTSPLDDSDQSDEVEKD